MEFFFLFWNEISLITKNWVKKDSQLFFKNKFGNRLMFLV